MSRPPDRTSQNVLYMAMPSGNRENTANNRQSAKRQVKVRVMSAPDRDSIQTTLQEHHRIRSACVNTGQWLRSRNGRLRCSIYSRFSMESLNRLIFLVWGRKGDLCLLLFHLLRHELCLRRWSTYSASVAVSEPDVSWLGGNIR